jgi:hypothetical protein
MADLTEDVDLTDETLSERLFLWEDFFFFLPAPGLKTTKAPSDTFLFLFLPIAFRTCVENFVLFVLK